MQNYMVGDEVKIVATGATGSVTNGFYWRDAAGKPPAREMVPVDLNEGDRVYVLPGELDYA